MGEQEAIKLGKGSISIYGNLVFPWGLHVVIENDEMISLAYISLTHYGFNNHIKPELRKQRLHCASSKKHHIHHDDLGYRKPDSPKSNGLCL